MKTLYICLECGTVYFLEKITKDEEERGIHHTCKRMVDAYSNCPSWRLKEHEIVNGVISPVKEIEE